MQRYGFVNYVCAGRLIALHVIPVGRRCFCRFLVKARKLFVTGELYKKDGFITDNVDIKDIFGFSKNDISELNEFAIKKGIIKQAVIKQLKK